MAVHGGAYRKRRFERDAQDATPALGEAIQSSEVEAELRTDQILVQLGAGGATHYVAKPAYPITLVKIGCFASVNAASAATGSGLTLTLKEASSGGGTTATVGAGAFSCTTTSGSKVELFSTVCTASIPATVGLYLVAGATTKIDDNPMAFIQYTID